MVTRHPGGLGGMDRDGSIPSNNLIRTHFADLNDRTAHHRETLGLV